MLSTNEKATWILRSFLLGMNTALLALLVNLNSYRLIKRVKLYYRAKAKIFFYVCRLFFDLFRFRSRFRLVWIVSNRQEQWSFSEVVELVVLEDPGHGRWRAPLLKLLQHFLRLQLLQAARLHLQLVLTLKVTNKVWGRCSTRDVPERPSPPAGTYQRMKYEQPEFLLKFMFAIRMLPQQ